MFFQELQTLAEQGRTIRIGLVGAGQMGEGLICQCERIAGMEVSAVFSRRAEPCEAAYQAAGVADFWHCESAEAADEAIQKGKRAIVANLEALCAMECLDVVVEATGISEIGAQVALLAIENRKHIVQMNVEADATVGYILRKKAKEAGVVYTLSSGDEPGSIMELYDFARTLGFRVICCGKGKNNQVFCHATASDAEIVQKARRFRMNAKMLTSFVDGSKTMAEMCSLGNAIGYTPVRRGMEGHQVTPKTIASVYCPKEYGGILERDHIVDYAYGIAPGVFVVIEVEHPKLLLDFQYLALGEGPYYALYRPYHLVSLETPISILRCVLHGVTSLATDQPPSNEALTMAKRDMEGGWELGELGGENYYGSIDCIEATEGLLPLGLAASARLKRSVCAGSAIRYDDVELNAEDSVVRLRSEQDKLVQVILK